MKSLEEIRDLLPSIVHGCYQLPGDSSAVHYIPCSGGADSTAMAIVMHAMFPLVNFRLLFTDTKAEQPELYEGLSRLENYLGKKIIRVEPKLGLYEMIELPTEEGGYNGFLPGPNARWCTRVLKLEPFEFFMDDLRVGEEQVYTYVGIRADEMERTGLISHRDWILTELPFQSLGIGREEVFRILGLTVGIPRFYRYRTRSGCSCCPFQRKSELIGLLQADPIEFMRGAGYEKLSDKDTDRHPENSPKIWSETGMSMNHLTFPVPRFVDARTSNTAEIIPINTPIKRRNQQTVDLFDAEPMVGLWVGCEFLVNAGVGDHGVWWQGLVTFSTQRHSLNVQLQSHYEHRIQTPEVFGLSPEDMKEELKLVTYYIEVPASLLDTSKPSKGSFTWTQDESYIRLKHIFGWAQRTLHLAGLTQSAEEYAGAPEGSWKHEQWEGVQAAISRVKAEAGKLIRMEPFIPVDKIHEVLDEKLVSCAMCSI